MNATPQVPDDGSCTATIIDECAVAAAERASVSPALAERTVSLFAAIADITRFRIVEALLTGEHCVCDLGEIVGVSQSGVSHQLRLLRDRGLVTFRRDGKRAVYRLSDDHVRQLVAIALAHAGEDDPR